MNYQGVIASTMFGKAPDGWLEKISVEDYNLLSAERSLYYGPMYAKYRAKKIRDYDPDYGYFVGWRTIQVGIGDPVGYKYHGYIGARAIDAVLRSSVLTARVMGSPKKWDK